MPERSLVLISGPVAAGKTTTANGLAELARAQGMRAAAIDMDAIIEIVAGSDWTAISLEDRDRACHATAAFVQSLFDSSTELIAIAGTTLSSYEWDEVAARLAPRPATTCVLLRVSLDESVRRAQTDTSRVSTRNPEYVARLAAAIDWDAIRPADIVVETDDMDSAQVVAVIATSLEPPLLARRGGRG